MDGRDEEEGEEEKERGEQRKSERDEQWQSMGAWSRPDGMHV